MSSSSEARAARFRREEPELDGARAGLSEIDAAPVVLDRDLDARVDRAAHDDDARDARFALRAARALGLDAVVDRVAERVQEDHLERLGRLRAHAELACVENELDRLAEALGERERRLLVASEPRRERDGRGGADLLDEPVKDVAEPASRAARGDVLEKNPRRQRREPPLRRGRNAIGQIHEDARALRQARRRDRRGGRRRELAEDLLDLRDEPVDVHADGRLVLSAQKDDHEADGHRHDDVDVLGHHVPARRGRGEQPFERVAERGEASEAHHPRLALQRVHLLLHLGRELGAAVAAQERSPAGLDALEPLERRAAEPRDELERQRDRAHATLDQVIHGFHCHASIPRGHDTETKRRA